MWPLLVAIPGSPAGLPARHALRARVRAQLVADNLQGRWRDGFLDAGVLAFGSGVGLEEMVELGHGAGGDVGASSSLSATPWCCPPRPRAAPVSAGPTPRSAWPYSTPAATTTHRVLPVNIRWLEAYGNYVKAQTSAARLVVTDTFQNLLSQLPADFMQVHKSYAVPLRLVERLKGNVLIVAG